MRPRPGDLLRVDGCASVQFGGARALTLRVVTVHLDRPTFDGWVWLSGYVLDDAGLATGKREVFVQPAGLHPLRQVGGPAPTCQSAHPASRQPAGQRSPRPVGQSTRRR